MRMALLECPNCGTLKLVVCPNYRTLTLHCLQTLAALQAPSAVGLCLLLSEVHDNSSTCECMQHRHSVGYMRHCNHQFPYDLHAV